MIVFSGPFGPTDASVLGPHSMFDIESVTITQPATPGSDWSVKILTNYGADLSGVTGSIPGFVDDGVTLLPADLLIQSAAIYYGVILHSHDGYTAGDLYQAAGFQTAQNAINDPSVQLADYHSTDPVWLAGGGTLDGTGTISASHHGDGTTSAEYEIDLNFSAPAGFLTAGDFTLTMSSADCANGFLQGTGTFGGGSTGGGEVPESGTAAMLIGGGLVVLRRAISASNCWRRR